MVRFQLPGHRLSARAVAAGGGYRSALPSLVNFVPSRWNRTGLLRRGSRNCLRRLMRAAPVLWAAIRPVASERLRGLGDYSSVFWMPRRRADKAVIDRHSSTRTIGETLCFDSLWSVRVPGWVARVWEEWPV